MQRVGRPERANEKRGSSGLAFSDDGVGYPLVFLHGLGGSRSQAQAAIVGVSGVRRIVIDAPAHGESARSAVPLSFGSFADAMVDLLDELDVERAIFGGISMGSGIALRIALDFPQRVSGLVLVRPAWTDQPGRPHLDIIAAMGAWIDRDGVSSARGILESDGRFQEIEATVPLAAASIARTIDGVEETGRPDVLGAMVDSHPIDDLADLAAVTQPALVVATERDPLHPTEIADETAVALPNATSLLAPARYIEPHAHQDFVTDAINSFIASVVANEEEPTGDRP